FEQFAYEWLEESKIHWKLSHYKNVVMIFERYLIPEFGQFRLNEINRTHIIKYRASILEPKRNLSVKKKLSNDWINHVMTPLRKMLKEASL
ncbi:phage integrase central domain-containing protein, partial [Streptomyces scabiei]